MRATGRFAALARAERSSGGPHGEIARGPAAAAPAASGSGAKVGNATRGFEGTAVAVDAGSGHAAGHTAASAAARAEASASAAIGPGVAQLAFADAAATEPMSSAALLARHVGDAPTLPDFPARRRNPRPLSAAEHTVAEEPVSVRIGAIDVIVEPLPARREAAPAPAPLQPLARGFLSALGLRQG